MRKLPHLTAALLPVMLAGCVMGPDYERPEVAQPGEFRSQIAPADANSFADLAWWQVFDDPEGDHDWGITASIDLAASDEAGEPVLTVTDVGPLSAASSSVV